MSISKESLKEYFNNLATYNKNENIIARDILKYFQIDNSDKLYRFGQYVKYRSDSVADVSQTMQTLDFTLFEGEGDCEDYTRAYVILLKNMKLPVWYWLMWKNRNYDEGHAIPLYISEDGYLTALNYTTYYQYKQTKLSYNDFSNGSSNFQLAFNAIRTKLSETFNDYFVNVIVQTTSNENPEWVFDVPYIINQSDVYYKSYPQNRTLVLKYIQALNLERNLSVSDFTIPIISSIIVVILARWLL